MTLRSCILRRQSIDIGSIPIIKKFVLFLCARNLYLIKQRKMQVAIRKDFTPQKIINFFLSVHKRLGKGMRNLSQAVYGENICHCPWRLRSHSLWNDKLVWTVRKDIRDQKDSEQNATINSFIMQWLACRQRLTKKQLVQKKWFSFTVSISKDVPRIKDFKKLFRIKESRNNWILIQTIESRNSLHDSLIRTGEPRNNILDSKQWIRKLFLIITLFRIMNREPVDSLFLFQSL